MRTVDEIPEYSVSKGYQVPFLDYVITYREERQELVIFAVNRRPDKAELEMELQGFNDCTILEAIMLCADNLKDTNLEDHMRVVPVKANQGAIEKERYRGIFQPYSWNMIRIKTGGAEI